MAKGQVYVALLRGVNVGGKNMLSMKALAEMFVAEGCEEVRTFIQSGNVVFRAGGKVFAGLAGRISGRIEAGVRIRVPVVLRSLAEMEAVVAGNPLAGAEEAVFVMFLADVPGVEAVAGLDPGRSPGEEYVVVGREIYLRLVSAAKTKLTNAYFDKKLGTVGTLRNWRTVGTLVGMMRG